jgi:hypothetical protein
MLWGFLSACARRLATRWPSAKIFIGKDSGQSLARAREQNFSHPSCLKYFGQVAVPFYGIFRVSLISWRHSRDAAHENGT